MNPQQLINACESTIKMQMVEIDRLRDEIKQLIEWINGDRDALTCLQAVYNNPNASDANRVKAAAAAIGFERPKMTVSVRVGPGVLGDRLDQAKLVNPKLIEHGG
jgi:hypothetical protein